MRAILTIMIAAAMAFTVVAQDDTGLSAALTAGDTAMEQADYAAAETAYQQAIDIDATSISAYLKLGHALQAQYNTSATIANYTQAIENNPSTPELYVARAKVLMENNGYQQAYIDLNKAIELDRENPDVYATLADLLVRVGNLANQDGKSDDAQTYYALAMGQIETALAFDDSQPLYYEIRARLYSGQGDLQTALANFNQAVKLAGTADVTFLISRGEFLLQVKQEELGLADFEKAAELAPQDSRAYIRLGNYYAFKQDLEKAKTYYQQAITADPGNPDGYFYLANIFGEEGKLPAAIELLNSAISINAYNDTLYLVRADALRFSGDDTAAIADYSTSLELRPNDPRALISRAQSYLALEDNANALADFKAFVDVIGEDNATQEVKDIIAELESKVEQK